MPSKDFLVFDSDSHVVEPPALWEKYLDPEYRTLGKHALWRQEGRTGAYLKVNGETFRDKSNPNLPRHALWRPGMDWDAIGALDPHIKHPATAGASDPQARLADMDAMGVDQALLYPTWFGEGFFLVRDPDVAYALARAYNDWIADFCKARPDRLKGIAMLNVDDPDAGARELERVARMGIVGSFIPVAPRADKPYSSPVYDRFWATAQELKHPLLLHIGTPRDGVPGNEFTMDITELTGSGRSTTDYWVRYALGSMVFAGVFDKFPGLKIGSVEHEAAWIPHWLKQMDFTYVERPVFTKGWKSSQGLMPSDYWKQNMFVEFMEDDLGVQLRDRIGVENMLWGSDYPHAEATFPRSQRFLERMFEGVPETDARKITSENSAKMFGFTLN
jgi:predicted TIM-barrel fold metal-dependent hydrolase